MEEAKIPVFSVLKKGAMLKNIFLNSPTPETRKPSSPSGDKEPILMGRHPDCHIVVDHPSISRFHLEVRPKSSLQKLFVTDRSSVHGTWVSGEKIQPEIPIELIEGDTIRLGASTRIYRLHWMPLSHAFEMEKPMSPLIEESSDFMDNDEVLQDENLNQVLASNIIPSAPPMASSSPGKFFTQDFENETQILIRQEKLEQSSCSTNVVPLLESVSSSRPLKEEIGDFRNPPANEMQPEEEEPSPFRPDKIAKSSSLLLRRNKSISFLQIEKTSEENGRGDLEIEEQIAGAFAGGNGEEKISIVLLAEGNVKEEEEESFVSEKENMTPVNSICSKVLKIERSPLSSFSLFDKEDFEIEEPKVGALTNGNGEEIPSVFLAEGDVKEKEEEGEICALDEEEMTLNSIGSKGLKSNRDMNRSLLSSFNISINEEEDDNRTLVNSIDAMVLETSPLSSLSTLKLEEELSNSDKPVSTATGQYKSNKLRSRRRLIEENGDSKLSDAKNLESLFSPGSKLQRTLFKSARSPLGEKRAVNVRDDRIASDKENLTPEVPKSSKSGKAFADLLKAESKEDETFASDKENLTPQSLLVIKSKKALSQSNEKNEGETTRRRKERIPFQPLFVSSPLRNGSPASYVGSLDETLGNNYVNTVHNLVEKEPDNKQRVEMPHMPGREKKKWYIVVDVGCFLTEEYRKSLQLLEGIRGTQLIIPRIVIRELDHLKRCQGILSRGTKASSILQWIEQSMMKNSWWIHVQSSSETFPAAPTPPATPRSLLCDGSSGLGATSSTFNGFSTCGSLMEIVSPTAEDHILDCALLFKRMKDDGQLMLLTGSTTLRIKAMAEVALILNVVLLTGSTTLRIKAMVEVALILNVVLLTGSTTWRIKAMAEGLLCETPKEFRESLVNPLSKRFLWADSSPRGSTWSCLEEADLPQCCHQQFVTARMPKTEGNVKGLKLILLHGSHCGLANSIS